MQFYDRGDLLPIWMTKESPLAPMSIRIAIQCARVICRPGFLSADAINLQHVSMLTCFYWTPFFTTRRRTCRNLCIRNCTGPKELIYVASVWAVDFSRIPRSLGPDPRQQWEHGDRCQRELRSPQRRISVQDRSSIRQTGTKVGHQIPDQSNTCSDANDPCARGSARPRGPISATVHHAFTSGSCGLSEIGCRLRCRGDRITEVCAANLHRRAQSLNFSQIPITTSAAHLSSVSSGHSSRGRRPPRMSSLQPQLDRETARVAGRTVTRKFLSEPLSLPLACDIT